MFIILGCIGRTRHVSLIPEAKTNARTSMHFNSASVLVDTGTNGFDSHLGHSHLHLILMNNVLDHNVRKTYAWPAHGGKESDDGVYVIDGWVGWVLANVDLIEDHSSRTVV